MSPEEISRAVFGMRMMDPRDGKVRGIARALAGSLNSSNVELTSSEASMCIGGLRFD